MKKQVLCDIPWHSENQGWAETCSPNFVNDIDLDTRCNSYVYGMDEQKIHLKTFWLYYWLFVRGLHTNSIGDFKTFQH